MTTMYGSKWSSLSGRDLWFCLLATALSNTSKSEYFSLLTVKPFLLGLSYPPWFSQGNINGIRVLVCALARTHVHVEPFPTENKSADFLYVREELTQTNRTPAVAYFTIKH